MLAGRGFLALVAVTAVVVAGAVLTLKRDAPVPEAGALVFPDLLSRVNEAARVEVTSAGETFRLERDGSAWGAPARAGYPLVPDKVHSLLVGAAGLERLEPKTADPVRFEELGLRDPTDKASRAVGFRIRDASDNVLAELIVGEQRPAKGDPARTEYFVRLPGEARSWLVQGNLPRDGGELTDWLDKRIAAIGGARIARVRVTHPDGTVITAARDAPGTDDFTWVEKPADAELRGAWVINDLGRVLTDLTLEDVSPAAEGGLGGEPLRAVVETFDGLRVRIDLDRSGDLPRARLGAEYDAALAEGAPQHAELLAPEKVREEAAALDARWSAWVYVLPSYKADYLARRAADLVQAPETAGAAPGGAGASAETPAAGGDVQSEGAAPAPAPPATPDAPSPGG